MLRYWGMCCAAFNIVMESFGKDPTGDSSEVREAIRKEYMVLSGLASFVLMYPPKAKQVHSSTAHA